MAIRMLVAVHKASPVPNDEFYLPVHVGRALTPTDLGFQGDDTGDNISRLNRSYCELTAQYWAWKNLDASAIGLSHYRRYFSGMQEGPQGKGILSKDEADGLMKDNAIILAKPRHYIIETIEQHYRHGHHGEDLAVLRQVIEEMSPSIVRAFDDVLAARSASLYNMTLMRRDMYDAYCAWLFTVLGESANRVNNDARSDYQQRTFGFLAERLLNVWVRYMSDTVDVGYRSVVNTEGEPKVSKAIGMVKRKLFPVVT